jgi:ABC-type spermidine/putrescine transport system permease subunit II
MLKVKCLVVKSCNGYVDGLYGIVESVVGFLKWIWNGKLDKEDFLVISIIVSIFAVMISTILLHPATKSTQINDFRFLQILGISIIIPLILTPIYNAVYDCLVDEDLKFVE